MDRACLQTVRSFNRAVALRIGALEESYLRRGRPLGAARLLHEIGVDGAEVRALRERLRLDAGYLSRLLRALEAEGLVVTAGDHRDRRARRAALTPKGAKERAAYDALSDELATSLLAALDASRRERLLTAMDDVERLLRAAAIELRAEPMDGQAASACLRRYFDEIAARFDGGFDPAAGGPDAADDFAPPRGNFLLAWMDGTPVGCGALRIHAGEAGAAWGEVKRLWTAPEARGLGVARRVLRALEDHAREAKLPRLRLDTNRALSEAHALYLGEGFREIAPFNDNPYAHHWFEKTLA